MASLAETTYTIEATYRQRTPRSAALHERAVRVMPGGDTRISTYFGPYPLVVERGEGPRLYDADGHEYLDFLNNYTALIHGHAYPPVVEAARRQVERGSAWGAVNEHQIRLAELICGRVPSVERLRFTNSGTEATLLAIRAARAFTGRDAIVKIEGGYHGSHDFVAASVAPDPDQAGPAGAPLTVPEGPGVARGALAATRIVPYNNPEALEQVLVKEHGEIAAVIVEPILGSAGMIHAEDGYLKAVRDLTQEHDVLLILDEVMSFRLDTGGAQAVHGVRPDLTSFAKIIGGGLPVGAFGGREEVMSLYDPRTGGIHHGGTFNANPATMAAGLAAMESLTPERLAHANQLGDALREGLSEVLDEQVLAGQITGYGSLVGIHLTAQPVRNYRDAARVRRELRHALHLACLNRGLLVASWNHLNTSTVMTEHDVRQAVQIFQEAIVEMKPAIEAECPELVVG
jgi:glutamate-1-semialdehyde 2,1-aminomutase